MSKLKIIYLSPRCSKIKIVKKKNIFMNNYIRRYPFHTPNVFLLISFFSSATLVHNKGLPFIEIGECIRLHLA